MRRELGRKRVVQDQLLSRLPAVGDLQSAWLLLLFCASPRANYRMLPPGATQAFAREHDTAVRACLAALLFQSTRHPLPEPSQRLAHLGLGLLSSVDAAPSAYWASWADCLPAIRARQPTAWARRYSPRLRPLRPLQLPVTPPPIFASRATMPLHGPRCSRGSRRPSIQTGLPLLVISAR